MLKFKVLNQEGKVVDFIYADSINEVNEQFKKIVHSFELCSKYNEDWYDNKLIGISNIICKEPIEQFWYTLEEVQTLPKITDAYYMLSEIAWDRYNIYGNNCVIPCRKKKIYPVDTFANLDKVKACINLTYCNVQQDLFVLQMKDTWNSEDYALSDKYTAQINDIRKTYLEAYGYLPIYEGLNDSEELQDLIKHLLKMVKA